MLGALQECSTSGRNNVVQPDPKEFYKSFLKAKDIGKKSGIPVKMNSCKSVTSPSEVACGACGVNFCVTPEGYVSSCPYVRFKDDFGFDTFIYGRINEKITLNKKKFSNLKKGHNQDNDERYQA